jgi:large subunit ribosomal protein L21
MSYAIIETGGKQLRVEPGRFYDIELLHVEPEAQVTIDKVLLVQHNDDVTIGQPFIEGATVEGRVMRNRRGKKVIVYKMRPKKKTRKKRGHRQEITQLMIDSITLNGSVISSQEEATGGTQAATTAVAPEPEATTPVVTEPPQTAEIAPVAEEPAIVVEAVPVPEATTAPATEEAQAADSTAVAQEPAVVEAALAYEQTTAPATEEAQAADSTPVAEEPDAQTVEPDAAQSTVESVAAEEPDAETVTSEQSGE